MFLIGTVERPHARFGEVSVSLVAGFPGAIASGMELVWSGAGERRRLRVLDARPHGERMLVAFEGVGDLAAARALSGGALLLEEKPPAPPDFYYSHEIAGWRCEDPKGSLLGFAKGVEQTAAGPLLTFETPNGREVLVPFVRPIVVEIDRDNGKMVLDLPEGLMEL